MHKANLDGLELVRDVYLRVCVPSKILGVFSTVPYFCGINYVGYLYSRDIVPRVKYTIVQRQPLWCRSISEATARVA